MTDYKTGVESSPMNNLQAPADLPLSEDEAKTILERLFPYFWQIVLAAWQDWEKIPPAQRLKIGARARANNIYDFIAFHARFILGKVPGCNIIDHRGLMVLGVDGRAIVRFKKLRDDKRTSNIMTQQQMLFSTGKELPGMPPKAGRLVVGYLLNLTATGIEALLVTCQQGTRLEYYFDIPKAESNVVPLPLPQERRKPKVRAIKISKPEEEGK